VEVKFGGFVTAVLRGGN